MIDSALNESIFILNPVSQLSQCRFGKRSTLGALPLIDLDTNKVFCNQIRLSGISSALSAWADCPAPHHQAPPVASEKESTIKVAA